MLQNTVKIAQFVDEELTRFYGVEAFYKIDSIDDLIGHLIVGLAPHTSVGIIGRVIGFVNSGMSWFTHLAFCKTKRL